MPQKRIRFGKFGAPLKATFIDTVRSFTETDVVVYLTFLCHCATVISMHVSLHVHTGACVDV